MKHYLFEFMKSTDDTNKLKRYAGLVESIEFKLQHHWGFTLSSGFHDWFMVPKCECPKYGNQESRGTDYRHINPNCKVHG